MNEIIINAISVIVTVVVIPIITLLGTKIVSWINAKINNEKSAEALTAATNAVVSAVKTVLQTYVDALKKEGKFDEASQSKAFNQARTLALSQINVETQMCIEKIYGSLDTWLTTQIEATINTLKNK